MSHGGSSHAGGKIVVKIDPDIQAIVPGFLKNKQNDIKKIHAALEKGDFETIRILGHSMKGDGGGYGFDQISEFGATIEEAAKGKQADKIRTTVSELSDFLARVEVVYEA
jgi:HPt (histidine-containing phosphotransfer) domain-containing protein